MLIESLYYLLHRFLTYFMEKADFPKWLQNQKNHHESMSENLLTSQAEIRHR